jgi:hypothetical protein
VSDDIFEHWLSGEGRSAMREALRSTRFRWFFGAKRARRQLRGTVRTAFRPGGTFCTAAVKYLNQMPVVIRACAIAIQRTGHRQLCTFHAGAAIVVVPRGIVQNDVRVILVRELTNVAQVRAFAGLTERVLGAIALDAERALFDYIAKGKQLVDDSGRGMILEADPDFRWNLNGANGHYYYASSLDERVDLTHSRERRKFLGSIKELFRGQTVHLKRMRADEARETAEAFRILQRMDGRTQETALDRARRIRESSEALV